jgi:hypothetical protein
MYVLSIGGQTWAQIEWSASRRAWCIQDASGRCLAHCDAIHGQNVDAQTAITLAKRMIVDGRMPTPEEAEAQLRERLAAEDAASPAGADAIEPIEQQRLDELRIDEIAAQLEAVEQQRLEDYWIEVARSRRVDKRRRA